MEPAAVLLSAGPGATRAAALSAAASTLVAPLLDGPDRPLRLVGRTPAAVHLATGDDDLPLLAVTSAHAVRLPAGLQLAGTRPGDLPAGPVRVGSGRVLMGAVEVRVARWWAPPRPAVLDVDRALAAWCRLGPRLPCLEPVVAAALRAVGGRGPDLARAVPALVGLGTGLTPSGDDVLAGALVTLRAVARGGGARCGAYAGTLADAVAEAVADVLTGSSAGVSGRPSGGGTARRSTTEVSAALLRDAAHGRCIPELADLLTALDRGTDVAARRALRQLLGIGHSSGTALAHGSLIALRAARPAGERR